MRIFPNLSQSFPGTFNISSLFYQFLSLQKLFYSISLFVLVSSFFRIFSSSYLHFHSFLSTLYSRTPSPFLKNHSSTLSSNALLYLFIIAPSPVYFLTLSLLCFSYSPIFQYISPYISISPLSLCPHLAITLSLPIFYIVLFCHKVIFFSFFFFYHNFSHHLFLQLLESDPHTLSPFLLLPLLLCHFHQFHSFSLVTITYPLPYTYFSM